jgi:O-phosphoseryl-tRNA(Cys) synthetase
MTFLLYLSLVCNALALTWLVCQERRIDRLKLAIGYARDSAVKLAARVEDRAKRDADELRVRVQAVEIKSERESGRVLAAIHTTNQRIEAQGQRRKRA